MKTTATILGVLLLLLLPYRPVAQLFAEDYEVITTRDGLSHNTVQALLQDDKGYLWIGTYNGLCIYDGNNISNYKGLFGEWKSDWQHSVDALFEDNNKNIWLGSKGGGISCFNRSTQQFVQYCTSSATPFGEIECFCQDDAGRIWVSDITGRIGYLDKGKFITHKLTGGAISFITATGRDSVLFACNKGLYFYARASNKIIPFPIFKNGSREVVSCAVSKNHLAVLTPQESVIIDLSRKQIVATIAFASKERNKIYHRLAPATGSGFYYTDGLYVNQYEPNGNLRSSFIISDHSQYDKNEIINCVAEDKSGLIWLGTNSGLYKINRQKYKFNKYSRNNISRKITDNYVRSLYARNGDELWVGTRTGSINQLKYNKAASAYLFYKSYPLQLNNGQRFKEYTTNSFCKLKNGNLLAAGEKGVYMLDDKKNRFNSFMPGCIPDSIIMVWSMLEDDNSNIWIGTHTNGLYVLNMQERHLYQYKNIAERGQAGENNSVWNIYKDSGGTVWLGTNKGLFEVMGSNPAGITFKHKVLQKEDLANVWDIKEDKERNLWIGTTGHGIYRLTADRKSIAHHNSLPTNVISAIMPSADGKLWVSTVSGLYEYDPFAKTCRAYKENDGPVSDDFNFKCATVARDSEIFLGNKTGMVSFHPGKMNNTPGADAGLIITSLTTGDKDFLKEYNTRQKVRLDWQHNFFTASFSIMDFANPRRHRYRYMLQGFDDGWTYLKPNQSSMGYTNLPPGKYVLRAEGSADGYRWSSKKVQLPVHVIAAFWQRAAFWVLIAMALITVIILLIYRRTQALIKKEKAKNEIDKKIAELELRALQAQMNPHFIFNTINAIQHFILHNDELRANDYLSRFARLMRLFLESSKNKYIPLADEVALLKLYLSLEKLRFEDKFDYVVTVPEKGMITDISIPSMLLQPFVENALKHGIAHSSVKGLLKIAFRLITNNNNQLTLECTVEDNGVGREKAALINTMQRPEHISRGIELINDRIKTYNYINDQNITIAATDKTYPGTGTIVTITIPVSPKIN